MRPPPITARAPATPTPVYTRELTNRVEGLVMEEKKMARREHWRSRSFISPKRSMARPSWPKACTTFWFPTISSTKAVCSPRTWD